jgi:hypothetical protein
VQEADRLVRNQQPNGFAAGAAAASSSSVAAHYDALLHAPTHDMTVLFDLALPFVAELPLSQSPTPELWTFRDALWRELFILSVRTRQYRHAWALNVWMTLHERPVLIKNPMGQLHDSLIEALLEMHARWPFAPPSPLSPKARQADRRLSRITSPRVLSFLRLLDHPPVATFRSSPLALLDKLQELKFSCAAANAANSANAYNNTKSPAAVAFLPTSASLAHLSVLFAHCSPLTSEQHATVMPKTCRGHPFGVVGLEWSPARVSDRATPSQQARYLVESFERNVSVRLRAGDFQSAATVAAMYLPHLLRMDRVPPMRSDLLAGVLFATALHHPHELTPTFNKLRSVFSLLHSAAHMEGYGLDQNAWALYLRTLALQPFAQEAGDMAVLYRDGRDSNSSSNNSGSGHGRNSGADSEQGSFVTPASLALDAAYLDYLCLRSMETLEARWSRMRKVVAELLRRNRRVQPRPQSQPQPGQQQQLPRTAAADQQQSELLIFCSVIRMLDALHRDRFPFEAPPAAVSNFGRSSSSLAPLALLFGRSPSSSSSSSGANDSATAFSSSSAPTSWQDLADELHMHTQSQSDFLRVNPATNNVLLRVGRHGGGGGAGGAGESDAELRAVCFLTCRALRRAVEMQANPVIPTEPLTLVLENDAGAIDNSAATAAAAASAAAASSAAAAASGIAYRRAYGEVGSSSSSSSSSGGGNNNNPDNSRSAEWIASWREADALFRMPFALPADWLFQLARGAATEQPPPPPPPATTSGTVGAAATVSANGHSTDEAIPSLTAAQQAPGVRMLAALQSVFEELQWYPIDTNALARPEPAATAAAVGAATSAAASGPAAAHEFVFTFDSAAVSRYPA